MRLRLVCLDTDDYKYLRFERIVEQMKQAQGITEQLKAENQMEWVRRMSNLENRAAEIVKTELIYPFEGR